MKRLLLGLILLMAASASHAQAYSVSLQEAFTKDADIKSVKFTTGEQLLLLKQGESIFGYSFKLTTRGKSRDLKSNDIGLILRAIPNRDNALIAVYANGSSGSCCNGLLEINVAVVSGDKVKVFSLGTIQFNNKEANLKVDLKNKAIESIVATHIDAGDNELGDQLYSDRRFVVDIGFVDTRFRQEIMALISNPFSILGNEVLRQPLLSNIGADNFRELRDTLGVLHENALKDGRYLAVKGCRPHFCNTAQASIVIDGVSGGAWAAWGDSYEHKYGLGGSFAAPYEIGKKIQHYLSLDVMGVNFVNGNFRGLPK